MPNNQIQTLITQYFKVETTLIPTVNKDYNPMIDGWKCVSCGANMGPNNPRQYCYKSYCPFERYTDE
jgi:hypothetical protein